MIVLRITCTYLPSIIIVMYRSEYDLDLVIYKLAYTLLTIPVKNRCHVLRYVHYFISSIIVIEIICFCY